MIIPFEQMREDHERDVNIVRVLFEPHASRGFKMWVMATCAYNYFDSVHAVTGKDLLIKKYPTPVLYGNDHGRHRL